MYDPKKYLFFSSDEEEEDFRGFFEILISLYPKSVEVLYHLAIDHGNISLIITYHCLTISLTANIKRSFTIIKHNSKTKYP